MQRIGNGCTVLRFPGVSRGELPREQVNILWGLEERTGVVVAVGLGKKRDQIKIRVTDGLEHGEEVIVGEAALL